MNREFWGKILVLPGILLVLAGELLYWHDSIISPGYRALGIPLFTHVVYPAPTFCLFSYGTATFLLLGIAYVATRVRHLVIVTWCAFFLCLLGLLLPLQIGFSQPSWLDMFSQNNLEYTAFNTFANRHSYPDVGPSLDSSTMPAINGIYDRYTGTLLSLKVGWTFHVVGSLLFLAGMIAYVWRWTILRPHVRFAVLILLVALTLNLAGPLAGESFWKNGVAAERAGNLKAALRDYHLAMKCDVWNRYNVRVYQRLGVIAEAQNRVQAPEYHLLQGIRSVEAHNLEPAMAEFKQVMAASDPYLARQGRIQAAAMVSSAALTFYQSGSPGTAAFFWQQAASTSESHLAEDYMASRGQQDAGQLSDSLKSLTRAQSETKGLLLESEIYSSFGDIYTLRKDVAQGRLEYLQSVNAVESHTEYKDMRAQKALTDNLQQ